MADQQTIRLNIEVDTSKGTASIRQFANDAESATKKAGDAAKEGGEGFKAWSSSLDETAERLKNLLTPANVLGTFLGVEMVHLLHTAIAATVDYAQEMNRLQLVTGGTMEQLGELQDAASKMGVGADKLKRAFFFLSSEIESGGRNLAKLGISIRDETGAQRESLEIWSLVSDKFRAMTSETERAVAARKLLSRQGVDMLPVFEMERKQLEELGASGREFAQRFGVEGNKGMILFGGAISEVDEALTRLKITVITDIAPGLKLLAEGTAKAVDLFWGIPPVLRNIAEVAGVAAAAFALLNPWIAAIITGFTAFLIYGPQLVAILSSLMPQTVIDAWKSFAGWVSTAWSALKNYLGLAEAAKAPEPENKDREKTAAEMQIELALNQKLWQAQLNLAKATKDSVSYELEASQARQRAALAELAIEMKKTEIPAELSKLNATKTAIEAAGVAERKRIVAQANLELLGIEKQTAEQWLAIEATRRQADLSARIDAITQAKQLVKAEYDAFGISQQEYVNETSRLNMLELEAKRTALKREAQEAVASQQLQLQGVKDQLAVGLKTQAWADEQKALIETTTQKKIADIQAKGAKDERDLLNQNDALQREMLNKEVAYVAQAEQKDLAQRIATLEAYKAAHADNLQVVIAADADLFRLREEGYNRDVKAAIDAELRKTALYQDEVAKQIEIQAGVIDKLIQARDKFYKESATVLEQAARQTNDLQAAFATGFADAATTAGDAFSVMRKAGADTYQTLKSGFSDVLYNFITGASTIGQVFADLGKRILRSMTDAFAEIIAKQALMAAGFSLPSLLGTAGSAVAGGQSTASQAVGAVQQLGTAASGASQALGSAAGGANLLTVGFASVVRVIEMFSSGIVAVLQFLGSALSGGGSGGVSSVLNGASGIGSLLSNLSSGLSSIFAALNGGVNNMLTGVFDLLTNGGQSALGFGGSWAAGALGEGMSFIADAAPWIGAAYGLYQMFSGQLSPMSGAIQGAAIGTMIMPGVGTAVGAVVGTIAGFLSGLFGGPTPEVSGKTVLRPTDVSSVLSAPVAVHWGENGPQVVNPPGRSQFSYLDSGPFHEEMYYHRTEGQLSREQSQISIMNIILGTIQAAVKSVTQLVPQMPTKALSDALSAKLHDVLAAGFEITNFDVEGDDAVKKFGGYLKALSGKALEAFGKQMFPTIDLKALGGDDVVKGWDNLMAAMSSMGAVLKTLNIDTNASSVTLDQFAERSVAYFKQFAKDGEAFTDTVKRITTALSGILDLQSQVAQRQQALTGDAVSAITAQGQALMTMIDNIGSLADALHVAVESNASPEEVLNAAQALLSAYDAAIQAAQQLKAQIDALKQAVLSGVDLVISLTQKIDSLRGQTLSAEGFQFGLDNIVYLFNTLTDVTSRIALFAAALRGAADNITLLTANIPMAVTGFNAILDQIKGMSDPEQALSALKSLADAVESGLQAAIAGVQREEQIRIDALNAEKTAIQNAFTARKTALQDERTQVTKQYDEQKQALQAQLSLAQQWASVASSVKTQLTDLFNLLAPTHPLTSLNEVRAQFESAFAAFQAGPTTEGATKVQELAKRVLDLAKQTPGYELPSGAFQDLAGEVQSALQAIQAVTASQPSQEQIQAKIADLESKQADSLAAIDKQLSDLDSQQSAQLAAIDQQIAATQAAAQAQIQQFQNLAASGLEAIRNQVVEETKRLVEAQEKAAEKLKAVLGDKSFEQFIAEKQAEAATLLSGIDSTLKHYLGGIASGLGFSIPAMAEGGIVTRPTLALIGERGPEAVIPLRQGATGQANGNTTVNITFTYAGSARKDEWDRFMDTVIDDARFGKLSKVITDKVKGR